MIIFMYCSHVIAGREKMKLLEWLHEMDLGKSAVIVTSLKTGHEPWYNGGETI